MKTSLDHLPEAKRERLAAIAALLAAEAPAEMVILFGSYARGTWVEDRVTGYRSDFDLLVVVATEQLARKDELWVRLTDRARAVSGGTPVTLIAHDIKELNQEIRNGQYFFVDIVREGILLFDSRRHALASPKVLGPEERLKLAFANFGYWYGSASEFWRTAGHVAGRGQGPQAAFLLHQSVERFFAATLLVYTGYKPKSHNIEELADQAAPLHPTLSGALPRTEAEDRRLFLLLKRAYIDARYSKKYRITAEELRILRGHVRDLAARVREACGEKLASFCGAGAVEALPEVPSETEVGEFAEGKQVGIAEGLARALLTVLSARGIAVDAEARARIEGCREADVLQRWTARAANVGSTAELFALDTEGSERR